jgi:predicted nuclease with TOPRIM domain
MNMRGRVRELEDERDELLAEVSSLNRGNKALEARIAELEKENRRLQKRAGINDTTADIAMVLMPDEDEPLTFTTLKKRSA